MIDFIIVSSLMITSPVWVLGYDYLNDIDQSEQDQNDTQDWWF